MIRGEEIRKLAQWLGWVYSEDPHKEAIKDQTFFKFNESGECVIWTDYDPDNKCWTFTCWDPRSNIEDAWMLVEKLKNWRLEYEVNVYSFSIMEDWPPDKWVAEHEDAAPLAICRAVLELIEEEE